MKTLEITTESGTYLVLELPEDARDIKHSPTGNWIHFLHEIEDKALGLYLGTPVLHELPDGEWQLIGSGKDHPKLVEQLGIYNKNPFPDNPNKFHITTSDQHEQAEKRVFKNSVILSKND